MPVVVLITPCRNAVATLDDTISSVLHQKNPSHVLYHVQDGDSHDGTQELLAEWAERLTGHPWCHFSFCSEPDAGMYDALSRAVARIDIPPDAMMGWINADDRLLPDCLQALAQVMEQCPQVQWLGGAEAILDEQGTVHFSDATAFFPQTFIAAGLCDGLHWSLLQQEGSFWKKSLWDAAGGIDPSFRLAGDWDLWRRMAVHAPRIQLPHPLSLFCRRAGQLSADVDGYLHEIDVQLPRAERRSAALAAWWRSIGLGVMPVGVDMHFLQKTLCQCRIESHFSLKRRLLLLVAGLGLYPVVRAWRMRQCRR